MEALSIERHRTAIGRAVLSRPIRLALEHGVLCAGMSVMDYGCGRGDDAARLSANDFQVAAWDPHFRPDGALVASDVVNLGFVLNVIESPAERLQVLRAAWALARRVLVVAAQVWIHDQARHKVPFGDGVVTGRNTFQRYFDQDELADLLHTTLGEEPIPAALGVFYVFRDRADAARLRMGFLRRQVPLREPERLRCSRARPSPAEVAAQLQCHADRRDDLMLYLALAQFRGRPKFSALAPEMQRDVRRAFGSYPQACEEADALLFSLRDYSRVRASAAQSPIGKKLPDALYVHRAGLTELPLLLRLVEGCARAFVGEVEDANLVKIHLVRPAVGYLSYPDFDTDPHPVLMRVVDVDLAARFVRASDFSTRANPPILHRRELFVPSDYPERETMARITAEEEAMGLYDGPVSGIGTREGWAHVIQVSSASSVSTSASFPPSALAPDGASESGVGDSDS